MPLVHVENLTKSFQGTKIIKGVNFHLQEGNCVALIGANGAGKTTTLKMLSGLLKPTSGNITFEGVSQKEDIRKYIGYLPQHPVFFEWMTGIEFLEFSGELAGLSRLEAKKKSKDLLEMVGIEAAGNRRIGKYSGGMKQRLGIAQAIIHNPKLILLDEPVSALDPFGRREVLELLKELKKQSTVLFSTHILSDAEEVCDEMLFLHGGEIIESGTMEDFKMRYQQSKIDLQFSENAEKYVDSLSGNEKVQLIQVEGNKASVVTEEINSVKNEILQFAGKEKWPLTKYEISSISLEDVFMKVVQK